MHAARILSINHGWGHLINQKSDVWHEIEHLLNKVTIDALYDETAFKRHVFYSKEREVRISDLTMLWNSLLDDAGWRSARTRGNQKGVRSFSIRNTREGVAAQLLAVDRPMSQDLTSILLANAPRASSLGLCDVFVLLIPTDNCLEFFDKKSLTASRPLTESNCRAQIHDLQPLLTDTPVVVVFFSPEVEALEVEEIFVSVGEDGNEEYIERSIVFPPEYYQAGVGILSYFGEILRQKYPDGNAKVRIEQQGNTVRMHIESPLGEIDIIEKELELYALVIKNQAPVEALLQDKLHIMALENKLEVAQMEIRQAYKMLDFSEASKAALQHNFEQEVGFLRKQIGEALHLATEQTASHERIQIAQISHSSTLFKDVLGEANGNQIVVDALRSLEKNLMSGIALIDVQDQIKESLSTVKQANPSLLNHLAGQIESGAYGVTAGYALDWIRMHV